jgi:hypothetical protein
MLPVQTSLKKFFVPTKSIVKAVMIKSVMPPVIVKEMIKNAMPPVIVQAVMIKNAMPPAQSIAMKLSSGEVQPLLSGCGALRPWILRLTLP